MIRSFRETDAIALPFVFLAAIRDLGAAAYSALQLAAWSARVPSPPDFIARTENGARIWVAVDARDRPIAYALLEADGHLDHLYCHPDHIRNGFAAALLAQAENSARTHGVARLYTEASEIARPVFEHAGYTVEHRRDFDIDGVAIHNYAMEKLLTGQNTGQPDQINSTFSTR